MAGVESAVQIHIERGDDLNARDANGMTPLMLSALRNKPAICKLLLDAGADPRLFDAAGKTALEVAVAADSAATAAILTEVLEAVPLRAESPSPHISAEPSLKPDLLVALSGNEFGDVEFDLSGWAADEEVIRPDADLTIVKSAGEVQTTITAHESIDSSIDWNDIDAYLPDVALPLASAGDSDGRALLRCLLLRAIREGSVPSLVVQDHTCNEDGSVNLRAESLLKMIINDLGAEVEECGEFFDAHRCFEGFIDPVETHDEETVLDEALAAIDRVASPRHEPLQIYQREFQYLHLLSAEEEVHLAKDMEAAIDSALDALAEWPEGLARLLGAGSEVMAGSRPLSSIWIDGAEGEVQPVVAETSDINAVMIENPDEPLDKDGEPVITTIEVGALTFEYSLKKLASLVGADAARKAPVHEIRQALSSLQLNRRFLLEMANLAQTSASGSAFLYAISWLRRSRDRMTTANLKLAFFHAKKYLYCGEPLDDLAQEGNIGLLKAVDRFDWRRGFRFSTYATWWIRQQIGRFIADKARTIRIPVHMLEVIQRMERATQEFESANGREPTAYELAERLEITPQKLSLLQRAAHNVSSIHDLNADDLFGVEVKSSVEFEDIVNGNQLRRAVDSFISSLSTTDRKEELVLRMRFGIGIKDAHTLEEIGERFGVTRERIRQIEAKAIKKIRHPSRLEPFARLALGLTREKSVVPSGAIKPSKTAGSTEKNTSSASKSDFMGGATKPTTLEQVLTLADELGVPVQDERNTASGRIWVNLVTTPDKIHRRLRRVLVEFGFRHSFGRGYWK